VKRSSIDTLSESLVMKNICKLILPILLVCATASVYAQTLEQLESQWRSANSAPTPEKFQQLLPKLLAYRSQAGGNWQVNYMLGSSYCHIPGQEQNGKIALYRVLGGTSPEAAHTAAEQAISDCGGQTTIAPAISISVVPISGQVGATIRGKGGYEIDPRKETRVTKQQLSPVSVSELQKRLFLSTQSSNAVRATLARLGDPRARASALDGLVVVTGTAELPPEETVRCLAPYRRALEQQFGMLSPSALITVYVVTPDELLDYAARIHGINLPLGTVAYSVYEDLSIVGISSYQACGSLAHELVHLLIRQKFGDSPAWLEEGLASEVAVANPSSGTFRLGKSWRDVSLAQRWDLRPTVAKLIKSSWVDYAANDVSQVENVVALNAMSASFIRYLDSRGKLIPIYNAMRDALNSSDPLSDANILEQNLGINLDAIDADFVRWFGPLSSYR
jgi:hypothetical protein